MSFFTVILTFAALVAVVALLRGIRIVPQGKVLVVERLGKFHHVAHSGLNILIPFLDAGRPMETRQGGRLLRAGMVDLREQVLGFDTVQAITHDNVTMEVGSVIYYQVIDPAKALYQIENLTLAIEQLTMTNLRNIMGGLTLDQTLTSRETVNTKLREVLDEATEKWGVKVTRVELREIEPPVAIKESMAKQMTAERDRRAEVTRAEGDKAAAVLQAEGEKTARILSAEGERDALIAQAEGRKRAAVLDAEGKAEATKLLFEAIHDGKATPEVIALRYLETLQELGKGNNKLFVPYEASAILGAVGSLKELFAKPGEDGPPTAKPASPRASASQALAQSLSASSAQPVQARPLPPRPPLPSRPPDDE